MRVALLSLAFALAGCEQAAAPAPAPQIIPLNLEYGAPLVRMSLGGGEETYAIFDTGSQGAVINIGYARRSALTEEGPDYVVSPLGGDRIEGFRTTVRNATFNGVAAPPFTAAAVPLDLGTPQAIVSPDAFSGKLVTLDFGGSRLLIAERDPRAPPAGVESAYGQDTLPTITVAIGAQTWAAHLDTGSDGALSMSLRNAASLMLKAPPRLTGRARSVGADVAVYSATLDGDARVGPLVLHDPEIEFIEIDANVMNIGMGLIRRMDITLDPAARRVWSVERPEAP